jgi:GMP synthase-like glutamine amidotransferase
LRVHRTDRGELNEVRDFDALVVMGGPQGVYEHRAFPWIADELASIRAALDAGKPVLGICLGSQLIAAALGAPVYRHATKEIGWFDVTRAVDAARSPFGAALPERLTAFHWHGDTYDLPSGAVRLFESVACREQGFSVGGRVLALQFHPEITPEMLGEWARTGADELVAAPWVQVPSALVAGSAHCAEGHAMLDALLGRLFR